MGEVLHFCNLYLQNGNKAVETVTQEGLIHLLPKSDHLFQVGW